jgi:hypothetical protein
MRRASRRSGFSRGPPLLGLALAFSVVFTIQLSARCDAEGEGDPSAPKALKHGRYTLKLRVLETTAEGGGVQASDTVERSLAFRLR